MRMWSLNGLFFLKVVIGQTTINPHGLLLSSSTETMMAGCWSCISEPIEGLKSTSQISPLFGRDFSCVNTVS